MARVKRARKRSMGWDVALCILAPIIIIVIIILAPHAWRWAQAEIEAAEAEALGKIEPAAGVWERAKKEREGK